MNTYETKNYVTLSLIILSSFSLKAQLIHDTILMDSSDFNSGLERRPINIYVPSNYNPGNQHSLVLVLHGVGQTKEWMETATKFNWYAEKDTVIVVYLQAGKQYNTFNLGNVAWTSGLNRFPFSLPDSQQRNDIQYITNVIDSMLAKYTINSNEVFMCGFSNGGVHSHYYAMATGTTKVRAIGSMSGTLANPVLDTITPIAPVPWIHIHGKADNGVPYNATSTTWNTSSLARTQAKWQETTNCTDSVHYKIVDQSGGGCYSGENEAFTSCNGSVRMETYLIDGLEHDWADSSEGFGASYAMWEFFKRYRHGNSDNTTNVPQYANAVVKGNGIEIADGDATPSSADSTALEGVAVGDSIVVNYTIFNTGTDTLFITLPLAITGSASADFSVVSNPDTYILAGSSSSFGIKYMPSVDGIRTIDLAITNSDCEKEVYNFSISDDTFIATASSIVVKYLGTEISSGSLVPSIDDGTDFGDVGLGDTAIVYYTIKNEGNDTLTLSLPTFSILFPSDFSLAVTPDLEILAGDSTWVGIQMTPADTGYQYTLVSITNNDAEVGKSPYLFAIAATGIKSNAIEQLKMSYLQLYPNPVKDVLYFQSDAKVFMIDLFTTDGRLVYSSKTSVPRIDLSGFENGFYLMKVNGEMKRLIISR